MRRVVCDSVKNNLINAAIKKAILQSRSIGTVYIAAALSCGLASGIAQAQEESVELEEISVTGSRLRRDGMTSPTPVTAISTEEMRVMAPTLIMDSLAQMPQFRDNGQSQTGSIFTSGGGSNSVNLRGIGANRTLTLLNGRRVVSSQQAGTIDIALFPTALIQRVEVVTGGASAAYGSDAISGVTNFILNTDFEGISTNVQSGITDRSDHQNYQVEFAFGTRIGERGHLITSFDWYDADGVRGTEDRDWYQSWAMFTGPASARPRRFYAQPGRSNATSLGGVIPSGPLAGTQFIDGVPVPMGVGTRVVGNTQVGGGGIDPGYKWYALRPNDSRGSAFAHFKYDFDNDRSAFVQILKGQHTVEALPAPTGFAPAWSTTLFRDNPYLPQTIVDRMTASNVTSVPFNRIYEDLAPSREIEDEITSLTLGFDGDIGNDLFLSAYYQRGENIEIADYSSNGLLVRTDRFYRALDSAVDPATGRVTCRANIPAFGGLTPTQEAALTRTSSLGQPVSGDPESNRQCVPLNPFATQLPPEVIDYVTGGVHHRQKIRQDVFDVSLQTTLGGGGGREPISLGGGVAYREESVFQDAMGNAEDPRRMQDFGVFSSFLSPSDQIPIRGVPAFIRDRGVFFTGNPNNEGPIQGKFDVWEAFAESIVPILRGSNGQSADLHLAARYSSYTGSGGVWAGKVGGDWQLNDELRLRATWSRDTRAGSLSERFDTQTGGTNITDPLLPNEPPYIAATTIGGNPDIKPELSDTMTAGVVYQPSWLDGLSLSADYYDISIKDAISQLGGAQIVDRCYLQGATELCGLITRSAVGTPFISQIFNLYINVAETTTAGVDLEASYRQQVDLLGGGDEAVTIRMFANYLDEVTSAFVGERVINDAGEINYSKWLATASLAYANGPFSASFQTRFIGKSVRDVLWVEGIDIEDNDIDSITYTNMNLAYDFEWAGGSSAQVYLYVGNLFDKDPPLVPGGIGLTTGTAAHTNNGLFDTLGRTYSAGFRMRFE